MKMNIEVDLKDFVKSEDYGYEETIEDIIIEEISRAMVNEINDSVVGRRIGVTVANVIMADKTLDFHKKFEQAIIDKINRAKIAQKVEDLVNSMVIEDIQKAIEKKFDVEKMVKEAIANEVMKMIGKSNGVTI